MQEKIDRHFASSSSDDDNCAHKDDKMDLKDYVYSEESDNALADSEEEKAHKFRGEIRKINKMSVFYYHDDINDELKYDFSDTELENLSENEINENTDHLIKDD